jgi:beta-apo-4'-carotenal oxygenase
LDKPESCQRELTLDSIEDNKELILAACKKDIGKSRYETFLAELNWCLKDILFMQKNTPRFAKEEKPTDISFQNKLFGPRIRKDPLGAVLIIGYAALQLGTSQKAHSQQRL